MSRDCAKEIGLLVKAGWRLIGLEAFEEERALATLRLAAQACKRELVTWSVASGLGATGHGAGALGDGLRAISAAAEPAIFAVLDAHRQLHDPLALRRMRDMLDLLGERMQAIVLLGPALDLPSELVHEAALVELPLPRAAELEALFRGAIESPNPESLESAVRAALGLTADEALRVFRKSCALA